MESEFFGKSVAEMALDAIKKLDEECEPVTQKSVWNEPKGEVFVASLAEGFKVIFEAQEREREARLTPEEHLAEKEAAENSPLFLKLKAQWEREELELTKAMLERPLLSMPAKAICTSNPTGGIDWRVKAKVCECGVAITGGLHSDWCPLHEEPAL